VTTAPAPTPALPPSARRGLDFRRVLYRHGWTIGVYVLLGVLVVYWRSIPETFGTFEVQSLFIDALPLCFAAMAQAVVVISGGIDLSVGSLMALVNVLSARYMVESLGNAEVGEFAEPVSFGRAIGVAIALIVFGFLAGALTGLIITVSRIADIIVTLAMLFVWGGCALLVLNTQAGGAPFEFTKLGQGYTLSEWIPTGAVIIGIVLLVWVAIRWTKPGLAIYAVGSSKQAAFLSGISVAKTRIGAYALGGLLAAMGGLALTATSGIGDPLAGERAGYTLNSVAAVVLGGVSLLGGVGGLVGPLAAALVLTLINTVLILKGVDQNWAQVIQGTVIVLVVMIGGLAIRQRGKNA
jgi:ribose transport system permease protein